MNEVTPFLFLPASTFILNGSIHTSKPKTLLLSKIWSHGSHTAQNTRQRQTHACIHTDHLNLHMHEFTYTIHCTCIHVHSTRPLSNEIGFMCISTMHAYFICLIDRVLLVVPEPVVSTQGPDTLTPAQEEWTWRESSIWWKWRMRTQLSKKN